MQVSVNTVKTQLARALKLLLKGLNREDFRIVSYFFCIFLLILFTHFFIFSLYY